MSNTTDPLALDDVFPEDRDSAIEDELDANGGDTSTDPTSSSFVEDTGEDTPSEQRPKNVRPRSSTANLLSLLWGGTGQLLVHTQRDIPVGRVLQLQAPMAGNKLDQAIAGTWLDRALQPLVGVAESAEGFGALILFPLLIGVCERDPNLYPVLYPILKEVVEVSLGEIGPEVKKAQAKSRRQVQAVADLTKNLGVTIEQGQDPIDALLTSLFVMPDMPVETGVEEPPSA